MWPSNDDICAHIAGIFYDELLTKGSIQEGNQAAAKALHAAVKQIRSQHIQQPSLWAQYIHVGAWNNVTIDQIFTQCPPRTFRRNTKDQGPYLIADLVVWEFSSFCLTERR
jgi:hypothetical protein